MDQYGQLLERAKWESETVTPAEIEAVAALLPTAPEGTSYILLYILGCVGNATTHRTIVERYLSGPDDQLASLALEILYIWWDLTAEYKDELLMFLPGVEWDYLGEAQRTSTTIAGEYLRDHPDPDLLEALLETYKNKDNEHSVRQYAFYGLVEAVGGDLSKYPPRYEDILLDPPPDPAIITMALKRLVTERLREVSDR